MVWTVIERKGVSVCDGHVLSGRPSEAHVCRQVWLICGHLAWRRALGRDELALQAVALTRVILQSAGKSSLPQHTVPTFYHSSRAWRLCFSLEMQMILGKLHTLMVYQLPPLVLVNTFVRKLINSWLRAKIGCRIVLEMRKREEVFCRRKAWDIGI